MVEQLSLFDIANNGATLLTPAKREIKKNGLPDKDIAEPTSVNAIPLEEKLMEKKIVIPEEELPEEKHIGENADENAGYVEEYTTIEQKPATDTTHINGETVMKEEIAFVSKPENITVHKKRGRKSFKEIDNEVDLISIPVDEELFKKQYYPISTVAKWFRVNASLLRFWENEFSILKPRKTRKGDRLFRPEDVKNLQVIYHLLRQRKFTIEGAKKYLKANKQTADVHLQIIQSLNQFKSFLLELKLNLDK
jgi:DNA-binding transcriptional MerR regulator